MTYRPREFWEQRLREQFDLRGTGETGLSLEYNRACYALRGEVLQRALREAGVRLQGARVLDVGCGTGFFTAFYIDRGAHVTGVDITTASIERLAERYPQARFELADVSDEVPAGPFDVVNSFDVFFHITQDERWERALRNVCDAVAPGGVLAYTDVFTAAGTEAEHNRTRAFERHHAILKERGLEVISRHSTHVLLNRDLGAWRMLNRFPGALLVLDRALLRIGHEPRGPHNELLVARKRA